MSEYLVTAKVLNMGLGELIKHDYITADNEKDAEHKFIKKYLTLDIINVEKTYN